MAEIENNRYVKYIGVELDVSVRALEVETVYLLPFSLIRESTDLMLDVLAETVAQQVKEVVRKYQREHR